MSPDRKAKNGKTKLKNIDFSYLSESESVVKEEKFEKQKPKYFEKLKNGKYANFEKKMRKPKFTENSIKESHLANSIHRHLARFSLLFMFICCLGMSLMSFEDMVSNQIASYKKMAKLISIREFNATEIVETIKQGKLELVNMTYYGKVIYEDKYSGDYYNFEDFSLIKEPNVTIFFSIRQYIIFNSILNILKLFFFIGIYFFFIFSISRINKKNLVEPLESLIAVIDNLSKPSIFDPIDLALGNRINMMFLVNRYIKGIENKIKDINYMYNDINMIRHNIIVIQELLLSSMGTLGSKILKQNIGADQKLNMRVEGHKSNNLIGLLEISNVENVVREKDLLTIFNSFASIVHLTIVRYGGYVISTNKNVFMSAWTLPEFVEGESSLINLAFLCLVHTMIKIKIEETILRDKGKLTKSKIEIRFSLTYGECYEGPIGTNTCKIDSAILGPATATCKELLAFSKKFNLNNVISDRVFRSLSTEIKKNCREFDAISFNASIADIHLFTANLFPDSITSKNSQNKLNFKNMKQKTLGKQVKIKKRTLKNQSKLIRDILNKPNFINIFFLNLQNKQFIDTFAEAYANYTSGDWTSSKVLLLNCLKIKEDETVRQIFDRIAEKNFKAPLNWEGVRNVNRY